MPSPPPSYENRATKAQNYRIIILSLAFILLTDVQLLGASGKSAKSALQKAIVDYRHHLAPGFKKRVRATTKYILVHTSEGGLASTLNVVSRGKVLTGRHGTPGGHAHYVIARDGKVYRILDPKYRADHAGLSMWDGETDLSNVSIGIELVGYHYADITARQYRSLGLLIGLLQERYGLNDRAVLTHSQVAYGRPNRWHKTWHRGRKRCAGNLDRERAGLKPGWDYDPDVRAGRLTADPELTAAFYAPRPRAGRIEQSNVITKTNSAWMIAGEDYDSPSTWYKLPDGRVIAGDIFDKEIGWACIPGNTTVLLNQEGSVPTQMAAGPIKTITNGSTAWALTGREFNKATTIYFLPNGRVSNGSQIPDWDELPSQTKVIVGYKGPFQAIGAQGPQKLAGPDYDQPDIVYHLAGKKLITGDKIKNFSELPEATTIFFPCESPLPLLFPQKPGCIPSSNDDMPVSGTPAVPTTGSAGRG